MRKLLVLCAVLSVAFLLGCSETGENLLENPVTGTNSVKNATPNSPSDEEVYAAAKLTICHFANDDDDFETDEWFSVVIRVSESSFPTNHALHGDCVTTASVGSVNCTCDD